MKKEHFLGLVVAIIVLSAIALRLDQFWRSRPEKDSARSASSSAETNQEAVPAPTGLEEPEKKDVASSTAPNVVVSSPLANEFIASPLRVEGQARGNWFFEATLPIRLYDAAGNLLASAPGQAQSDWMTADLVPFTATLEFQTAATRGYLVINRDNPSGLPEYDASSTIPVRFIQQ